MESCRDAGRMGQADGHVARYEGSGAAPLELGALWGLVYYNHGAPLALGKEMGLDSSGRLIRRIGRMM